MIVAKLNSCVKVKFKAFLYDVVVLVRNFLSFNHSKFNTDKKSLKAL